MDLFSKDMKNCRLLLQRTALVMILAVIAFIKSEAQVTVNVAVLPPYSPNIEDYADKTRIIVLAMDLTDIECSLRLTITGDNGIELVSMNDFAYSTFTVQNAVPVTLNGPDLSEYFDLNHLVVSGIDPAELQSQGLPPGNYRVCARVYNSGRPLSADIPAGCSNYFRVSYVQPPMLILPAHESVIESTPAQQIIFSWTPSPGSSGVDIVYP